MTVDAREQAIKDTIKQAKQQWISVEVKLSHSIDSITLFDATKEAVGSRFYFRLNDNETAYFGYRIATQIKREHSNKQAVFKEWQTLRDQILFVNPESDKHHLRLCGGFQFSEQRTSEEWQTFGQNHFVLPEVLISNVEGETFLTYTVERAKFSMTGLQDLIKQFESLAVVKDTVALPEVVQIENVQQDEWQSLVERTVAQLADDEKIVLSRQRKIKFASQVHIDTILKNALQNEKNSYLFVIESGDHTFISQTPEQLFRVENGMLSTKAVAGTLHRTENPADDEKRLQAFLQDHKNLGEHQIVVNSILEDIHPFVKEATYDTTPKILKNDHLYHLYTEIGGPLEGHSHMSLIDALHPTPALGGYPKAMAMTYIDEHEFAARGLYGAPVGMIDIYDDCEFIVAIRSMLLNDDEAILYAGAGIVKESDPAAEVAETALKFSPMMGALGVTEIG
ncbi:MULTISPECIES: isochorismate synthase [unclassified Staphylococcus]|uniref:isochorismate synthase n=1 Tax=unclassified Staphylococcus TaxID=91994 RepID=UPI0021D30319|nr:MULTISPECIES: isochorismate synthase [unclassified Staphylococcus]UXR70155.1 isochorismate synthase [Staphylococcus sp. IVB6246]UXR72214.1 isochorismate synthase [Staphylococcus sp. IVB6240]UXR74523.1 isochorismate synthase [Staphylococcus sp. IVB6238]UXR76907.1 isochorismate synthase [Staphylococcus sp. IVB6233]UXR81033.1 isochorismate synthase [Staphylococcus sp. IVB6218]